MLSPEDSAFNVVVDRETLLKIGQEILLLVLIGDTFVYTGGYSLVSQATPFAGRGRVSL